MGLPGADLLHQALQPAQNGTGHYTLVRDLEANVDHFNRVLGYGKTYDLILRRMRIAGMEVAAYTINGFYDTLVNLDIMREVANVQPHGPYRGREGEQARSGEPADPPPNGPDGLRVRFLRSLLQDQLAYSQVSVVHDFDEAVTAVMSGPMVLLVDGEPSAIVVDYRAYPGRNPSAPTIEQVMRGPQDGFVENIVFNTALVRRRVRDPGLRFEMVKVGRRSQTDVAVTYIEGLTNPALVAEVRRRLKRIEIDGIPTADQELVELLGRQPWNPFPTARLTERPDTVAINLYDGHVVVIIDTTPVALVLPISFFQLLQHPEDYHVAPVFGTYLRWVEFYGVLWAALIPPVWLLFATHPGFTQSVPALSFIGAKKPGAIPLPLQFILAELSIDVLRRAILNSPAGLSTTFGILGAVVLGDVSTKTGLFAPEALVYLVGAAIASFAVANLELGMTMRLVRLSLIVLEWLWALPGVIIGLLFWFIMAARTDSLGTPYLWPFIPFNWSALRSVLLREPVTSRSPRPLALHPVDRWRGEP